MKVISPLFSSMRGKLGGAVGSVSRGGVAYLRSLVIPTNPSTLLQTAIRQAVQSASALWLSTLTELQQEAWFDIATGSQTGKTLFAKVNQPRIYANNTGRVQNIAGDTGFSLLPAYFADPPADDSLTVPFLLTTDPVIDDSDNSLTINAGAGDWNLGADSTHNPAIFIYVSGPQTASRLARQRPYALVGCLKVVATTAPGDITVDLATMGYPTVVGRVFYVKVYAQDIHGRTSLPIEYRVTVVA